MTDNQPLYIKEVSVEGLDKAIEEKKLDCGTKKLLDAEWPEIEDWRAVHGRSEQPRDHLTGLALSGGGIRSATFCLGVIQALVKEDLFKNFDYLSTVSGGGYIGSSITWLTSEAAKRDAEKADRSIEFDATTDNFPYGSDDPREPGNADRSEHRAMLKYLRQHGNYLIPGDGITIKSGIAVVLRGIIANFLVWLPILSAVFVGLFWLGHAPDNIPNIVLGAIASLIAWVGNWTDFSTFELFLGAVKTTIAEETITGGFLEQISIFRKIFQLFLLLAGLFIVFAAVYSLTTWFTPKTGTSRYRTRRRVEYYSGYILWTLLILFVVGTIPAVWIWLQSIGGIGAALAGAATGVWGYLKSGQKGGSGGGLPLGLIATVGAILLLYGVLLISFGLGNWVFGETVKVFGATTDPVTVSTNWQNLIAFDAMVVGIGVVVFGIFKRRYGDRTLRPWITIIGGIALLLVGIRIRIFLGHPLIGAFDIPSADDFRVCLVASFFFLLAVAMGFVVNLNYMTIHRYYRDRLMETFLPDVAMALDNKTGPALAADQGHIQDLWRLSPTVSGQAFFARVFSTVRGFFRSEDEKSTDTPQSAPKPRSPYHIVNTNLILVNSVVRRYRIRGGDNFILSPLYCGSNATGWRRTEDYLGGSLTLATAMAISGAAANPNTGVGGVGLTRNPAVSILMGLLDIRLGYWMRGPKIEKPTATRPNHFLPGFLEFINKGLREKSRFLQLSDGGHFENLALYELIRRRVRLIVCCDAGADADTSFSDFQVTLRRIKADFGAEIKFEGDNNKPEIIVPSLDAGYPKGAKVAERGHIVGNITYADGSTGKLILLKTTLIPKLRLQVLGYRSANLTFPDQSTADQFFDEEQFEAYRELGYVIGSEMIEGTQLKGKLEAP